MGWASDLHAIVFEALLVSSFFLATGLVMLMASASNGRPSRARWGRLDALARLITSMAVPLSQSAALVGLVALIGLFATGLRTWPPQALLSSPEVLNKMMVSALMAQLWVTYLFLSLFYDERIRESSRLLWVYAAVGLATLALAALSTSIGSHLSGRTSVLDPLYAATGVETSSLWLHPAFLWVMELVHTAWLFGLPLYSFYRLLLVVDVGIVALILLLIIRAWSHKLQRSRQ